jgi:hypothetical protein
MEQHNPFNFFPELLQAFNDGFTENFIVNAKGNLICLSNPNTFYELDEVNLSLLIPIHVPATLFLITTKDGKLKGTLIDWEY